MIMNALRWWWCYVRHQRRGHAVIYNVSDNTWKCITCNHKITRD